MLPSLFRHLLLLVLIFVSQLVDAQTLLGTPLYGENALDRMGEAVAFSADGNRLLVSTLRDDENGEDAGKAEVFDWINGSWSTIGVTMLGEAADDSFGHALALSSDGNRMLLGAIENDGNGSRSGQVKVFEVETTVSVIDNWQPDLKLTPNPTSGLIYLEGEEEGHAVLVDQVGRIIYSFPVQSEKVILDLQAQPKGMYFLQLRINGRLLTSRIVKV